MDDPHTLFNAAQQRAIRWMADNIDKESKKLWNKKTIIAATGMTEGDYQHLMHELNREKYEYVILLIGGTFGNDFAVMNGIHGLVRRLDQVPAKDYWKDVATWFRSKRWSVPVFILGVVFPAIAGYILVVTAILKWFGWN